MRRADGAFEISDHCSRWILAPASRISALDPRVQDRLTSVPLIRDLVAAWRRDPTIGRDMLELHEELSGSSFRPPTSSDVEAFVIPFLQGAFQRGTAVALPVAGPFAARFGSGTDTERGVVGAQSGQAETPPPSAPARAARAAARSIAASPALHNFSIRWVDEVGLGISGVPIELEHEGGVENESTDGNGVAHIQDSPGTDATARVADLAALKKAVKPNWD